MKFMIDFPGDHSWVGIPMYQAIFCELLVVKEIRKNSNSVLQWFREKRYIVLLTELHLLVEYILFTKTLPWSFNVSLINGRFKYMLAFSSKILTALYAILVPPSVTFLTSRLSWLHKAKGNKIHFYCKNDQCFQFGRTFFLSLKL